MIDGADRELFDRSLEQATAKHTGADLDRELDALGWADALEADPAVAVALLFGHQGASNATSSALNRVLTHALGTTADGVVLPPLGQDEHTDAGGGGVILGSPTTVVAVVAGTAYAVEASALAVCAVEGIDPALGLATASGDLAPGDDVGPVDWPAALRLGHLALGHELVGASRQMLELARQHALDRVQFGRPIATFQAVRHRLAEALVAIEGAAALLDAAWIDGEAQTAAMAKALAGRSARTVARHCQQVLAGIGFTTEHPLHTYVRRVLVLEQLLGSTKRLTRALGETVVAGRELPALLPL